MEKKRKTAQQIVTDRIIKFIEENNQLPWQQPWANLGGDFIPTNFYSKHAYQGVNWFMAMMSQFASPYWLTLKQANQMGGRVKKGSTGTPMLMYQPPSKSLVESIAKDPTLSEEERSRKLESLRGYFKPFTAFNAEQIEGVEFPKYEPTKVIDFEPIAKAEKVIANMPNKPDISFSGIKAYYNRGTDSVVLPPHNTFYSANLLYATLLHEIGHATGHSSRLGRFKDKTPMVFGDRDYSEEELVAEMISALAANELGIATKETIDNNSAYIKGWSRTFKDKPNMVIWAMNRAIPAVDYIFGRAN